LPRNFRVYSEFREIPRKYENSAATAKFRGSARNSAACGKLWALVSNNSIPAAKIRYLPFSNTSPSDLSTILTTLLRLVEIAQELGQPHILVTVYLAIYSKAQQILWSRPKSLDSKVTMRLGRMHLIMAFLGSIGNIFGLNALLQCVL